MYDGNKITGERCRELSLQLINEKGCNLLELANLENNIKLWENVINTKEVSFQEIHKNQQNTINNIKREIKAEKDKKKLKLNIIKWIIFAAYLLAVFALTRCLSSSNEIIGMLFVGTLNIVADLLLSRYVYSKNKVNWLCVILTIVIFAPVNIPVALDIGHIAGIKGIFIFTITAACLVSIYALNVRISVSCRINAPSEIADSTVTSDPQYAARLASAQKKDAKESQEEYEHRKEQLEKDKLIAPTELERLRKIENSELYYVFIRYEAEIAKLDCFDCFTPSTSTKEKIRCIFQCFPTNCGNQRAFDLIWQARESYYVKRQECKVLEKQCADMLHDILHG
mgnify:CR=1 FL=1